jgi:hypothetical protein
LKALLDPMRFAVRFNIDAGSCGRLPVASDPAGRLGTPLLLLVLARLQVGMSEVLGALLFTAGVVTLISDGLITIPRSGRSSLRGVGDGVGSI